MTFEEVVLQNSTLTRLKYIMAVCCLCIAVNCLPGCVAAGVGYLVGQSVSANESRRLDAKAKYNQSYNSYKIEMEKLNYDRTKSGLKLQPVLSFDDWLDTQALTYEEREMFHKNIPSSSASSVNKKE